MKFGSGILCIEIGLALYSWRRFTQFKKLYSSILTRCVFYSPDSIGVSVTDKVDETRMSDLLQSSLVCRCDRCLL